MLEFKLHGNRENQHQSLPSEIIGLSLIATCRDRQSSSIYRILPFKDLSQRLPALLRTGIDLLAQVC